MTFRPLLSLALLSLVGCGSPAQVCAPGTSISCVGPGGCAGGQVCAADGTSYGICDCGGAADAGMADGGSADAPRDTGGPVTGCNPFTSIECSASQRCAVIRDPSGTSQTECVADGTVAAGGACADVTMGPDACARGLVCTANVCRPVCELATPTSCTSGTCTPLPRVLGADFGACMPGCNPLTQLRDDGTACPMGSGCYGLPTGPVCARAGTVAVGAEIVGTAFANSCVPGATGLRAPDGRQVCAAYCAPTATSSASPAGANGVSPEACSELGGSATQNCIYTWFFAAEEMPTPLGNTVGLCLEIAGRTYDDDGDPGTPNVAYPSCATLAPTDTDGDGNRDNLYFGCAPSE